MEICHCLCVIAAAVYIYTAVWKFKQGCRAGYWAILFGLFGALGAFGYSLYFSVSPDFCGVALLCCSLCLLFVSLSWKDELLTAQGKAVLITGCDTGFGHALAKCLSDMGVTVFAGVLNIDGPGAQQLKERESENLHVLQLDVTNDSQIEQAHRYIRAQVGEAGLWGLVNNAGILPCAIDAEIHPIPIFKRLLDVNFLSAVKMCQVFLPLLRRSRGRIVNVTSMAGEVPVPIFSAYGASKAALSIFSKTMRLELAAWGVKVAIIQPSGFRTNIFGNSESIRLYREEILNTISSEAKEDYGEAYISALCNGQTKLPQGCPRDLRPVVDDMCHALLSVKPKRVYTPGQMAWLLPVIHQLFPTALFEIIIAQFRITDCKPAGLRMN